MRPPLSPLIRLTLGGLLAFSLVACSGDDDAADSADRDDAAAATDDVTVPSTTPPTTAFEIAAADADACAAMATIQAGDIAFAEVLDGGEWGDIQAYIIEAEADMVGGYEAVADLVPDLSESVLRLQDLTVEYSAFAAEAESYEEFETWLVERTGRQPGLGLSALRLNDWSEERCGISTGNN